MVDTILEQEGLVINETYGGFSTPVTYWKIAEQMQEDIMHVLDKTKSHADRLLVVPRLRTNLTRCAMDGNLDDLTSIYRNTKPTTKVNVGYDQVAVGKFVTNFKRKYPRPVTPWEMAKHLRDDILLISDKTESQADRLLAVSRLRENLIRCTMDDTLDELTHIYSHTEPTTKVNVGYDHVAVIQFIVTFNQKYPQQVEPKEHE